MLIFDNLNFLNLFLIYLILSYSMYANFIFLILLNLLMDNYVIILFLENNDLLSMPSIHHH